MNKRKLVYCVVRGKALPGPEFAASRGGIKAEHSGAFRDASRNTFGGRNSLGRGSRRSRLRAGIVQHA